MTIEILITPTGKSYAPSDSWRHLATSAERRSFDTMDEAKAYLRERYGKCKRVPMYRDRMNTPAYQFVRMRVQGRTSIAVWVGFKDERCAKGLRKARLLGVYSGKAGAELAVEQWAEHNGYVRLA